MNDSVMEKKQNEHIALLNSQPRIGFLIEAIYRAQKKVFRKLLETKLNISPVQGSILFLLWQQNGVPISTLARESGLYPSALTAILDDMEKEQLIERKLDPKDRRKLLIFWKADNEHNKQLQINYTDASLELRDVILKGISPNDEQCLEENLRKIYNNLQGRES